MTYSVVVVVVAPDVWTVWAALQLDGVKVVDLPPDVHRTWMDLEASLCGPQGDGHVGGGLGGQPDAVGEPATLAGVDLRAAHDAARDDEARRRLRLRAPAHDGERGHDREKGRKAKQGCAPGNGFRSGS